MKIIETIYQTTFKICLISPVQGMDRTSASYGFHNTGLA